MGCWQGFRQLHVTSLPLLELEFSFGSDGKFTNILCQLGVATRLDRPTCALKLLRLLAARVNEGAFPSPSSFASVYETVRIGLASDSASDWTEVLDAIRSEALIFARSCEKDGVTTDTSGLQMLKPSHVWWGGNATIARLCHKALLEPLYGPELEDFFGRLGISSAALGDCLDALRALSVQALTPDALHRDVRQCHIAIERILEASAPTADFTSLLGEQPVYLLGMLATLWSEYAATKPRLFPIDGTRWASCEEIDVVMRSTSRLVCSQQHLLVLFDCSSDFDCMRVSMMPTIGKFTKDAQAFFGFPLAFVSDRELAQTPHWKALLLQSYRVSHVSAWVTSIRSWVEAPVQSAWTQKVREALCRVRKRFASSPMGRHWKKWMAVLEADTRVLVGAAVLSRPEIALSRPEELLLRELDGSDEARMMQQAFSSYGGPSCLVRHRVRRCIVFRRYQSLPKESWEPRLAFACSVPWLSTSRSAHAEQSVPPGWATPSHMLQPGDPAVLLPCSNWGAHDACDVRGSNAQAALSPEAGQSISVEALAAAVATLVHRTQITGMHPWSSIVQFCSEFLREQLPHPSAQYPSPAAQYDSYLDSRAGQAHHAMRASGWQLDVPRPSFTAAQQVEWFEAAATAEGAPGTAAGTPSAMSADGNCPSASNSESPYEHILLSPSPRNVASRPLLDDEIRKSEPGSDAAVQTKAECFAYFYLAKFIPGFGSTNWLCSSRNEVFPSAAALPPSRDVGYAFSWRELNGTFSSESPEVPTRVYAAVRGFRGRSAPAEWALSAPEYECAARETEAAADANTSERKIYVLIMIFAVESSKPFVGAVLPSLGPILHASRIERCVVEELKGTWDSCEAWTPSTSD